MEEAFRDEVGKDKIGRIAFHFPSVVLKVIESLMQSSSRATRFCIVPFESFK